MRRWRQRVGWWSGLGLLLLLLLARLAAATGPSYPTGLTATTISCGANPHVRVSWDISTPDPANNSPIWFYQVFKWDGPRGAMRADVCNATCPGTSARNFACCPGYPNAAVYPYGATSHPNCDVNGHCSFEETLDFADGPWYYAVLAVDRAGNLSQTPSTCSAPYVGGGGTCDLGGGCTPFPCFQCTYNGTSSCTTPGYCTPPPGACLDISACVIGPTTTTTSTSTTSTTTTLVSACASPTVIPAGGGPVQGTTSGASTLQGTCGSSTGPEKVYQWTPSLSGVATIQTCGGTTNFDTALYMRASTCTTGTEIMCNDDSCACGSTCGGTWASKITPTVTAGTTYYIIVDGRNGQSGSFTLTVTPPSGATTTSSSTSSSTTTTTGGGTTTTTLGGQTLWAVPTVGTVLADSAVATGVAATTSAVTTVGLFTGTVNFGGGGITSAGSNDVFIAQYSSAAGVYNFAHKYGDAGPQQANGVAVDGSGNLYVAGQFNGVINFGGGNLTSPAGITCGFVASFDSSGVYRWQKQLCGTSSTVANGIAVDPSGNPVVAGYFSGSTDFGNGVRTTNGSADVFVAKYATANGAWTWDQHVGGTDYDAATAVATDTTGAAIITGFTYGTTTNLGGGSITTGGGTSKKDIILAKYANADGAFVWGHAYGDTDNQVGNAVATDTANNVILVGSNAATVNFGGPCPTLTNTNGSDITLTQFSSGGTCIWAKAFGTTNIANGELGSGVATDASNNIFMTGGMIGDYGFGGATLFGGQTYDVFATKFNSGGTHVWSHRYPGSFDDYGKAISVDSTGRIALGGSFYADINFGPGNLTSPGGTHGFAARLGP